MSGAWLQSLGNTAGYLRKHPVGRRQPVRTLLRFAGWQARLRMSGSLQPVRWVNDSRLLARRGLTGITGNLYYGLHEFVEMSLIALVLRPDDLFADVGANAGSYTVLAGKVAGARTIAFEPGHEAADVFGHIVALNGIGALVDLRRDAVGGHNGIVRFTRGLGTMNKVADDGDQEVRLVTLDNALAGDVPTAIKFDIEGGEDAAVAGARGTLGSPRMQVLLIETVSEQSAATIAAAGLTEVQFDPWTRTLYEGEARLPTNNRIYVRDRAFVQERVRSASPLAVAGLTL